MGSSAKFGRNSGLRDDERRAENGEGTKARSE